MSASSSPLSAQKQGLKAKKKILPRASLIQVFDELPAASFNNATNLDLTQCHLTNTASNNKGNTTSNQEISFATANKQITTNIPKPVQV